MRRIVIVGNGIAGTTAAREIRKQNQDATICIIGAETQHLYSRPALMYWYMGQMSFNDMKPYEDWFWTANRIDLIFDHAEYADTGKKVVHLRNRPPVEYDVLVIATGSVTRYFDWPGQNLRGVQGFYSVQDAQNMAELSLKARNPVIIGGGLIGVEVAEMLHAQGSAPTILVRESTYWRNAIPREESELVTRHLTERGLGMRLNTSVAMFVGDEAGSVDAVITDNGERIEADFVCIATGVAPNIAFAKNSGLRCGTGIHVSPLFETSAADVFAIGDCAELHRAGMEQSRGLIEPLWYAAQRHARHLARNLTGQAAQYDQGFYFNSAKFFDIEYQVYGYVPPDAAAEDSHVWSNGQRLVRLYAPNGIVRGLNGLGVRLRSDACQRYIENQTVVSDPMRIVKDCLFDPEFTKSICTSRYKLSARLP